MSTPGLVCRSALYAAVVFVASSGFCTKSIWGQSQSINGTIRGVVSDATGSPVPGVNVTVKNLDTGYVREITTDAAGLYIAPALPIGTYSVSSTPTGFAPVMQTGIRIGAGTDATVDERLSVGSVTTQIDVSSDAPILEVARTDLSRTISSAETQNLPLTSRNPYNFILFQPGVSGHPNPENGIPRTVNTNGLVDRVNYQLDGMVDTESDRYGLRLFAVSDSYTETVQTISNGPTAEFGNTAGIIYNIITPSGTNQLHGSAQYIWRPKAASSCPMLQSCTPGAAGYKPKPDLHVDDYVGRLGGPVIKDRFFLFGAYEKLKRANPQAITVTPVTQAALQALGVPAADFNTAPQVQRAQWVDVRGDININRKNTAFIRYNYFRNDYPFNTNVGGLFLQSASSDFRDRAHIIGAQLITTFKPTLLNEFRGSWPYRNQQHFAGPATGTGPMITISAFTDQSTKIAYSGANFGGTNGAGDKFQEKIPSFSDNVTLVHGQHSFKVGVGFQKNNDTQLQDVYTQYTFPSITAYQQALSGANPFSYSTIKASIGRPGAGYQTIFFDAFAQDTWQVTRNLVANYGVRYDQYRAPDGLPNAPLAETRSFRTPMGNFAPRVGFAYTPHDGTVIRLSSGMFYEATPTNSYYNPLYANGATNTGNLIATSSSTAAGAPAFPGTFSASPGSISVPTPNALTSQFKNEYTWNVNAQVEQQLATNDSLIVGYVMTNGRNLQFLRNSNLKNPIGTLADGRPVYATAMNANTRVDPRFNSIQLTDIGANSSYNALVVTYKHRMAAGLTTSASYTWGHAISDAPEANSYEFSVPVADPSNRRFDRGNSSINRPNAFTMSAVYQPATHFANRYVNGIFADNNFAFLMNASSGDQQNVTTTSVLNNDPLATQRPLFTGRNTQRTPLIAQADLRYTRTLLSIRERIRPSIFIEANNLLNRSNATTINTAATVTPLNVMTPPTGAPTFNANAGAVIGNPSLQPTSTVLESRILQFGARIDF